MGQRANDAFDWRAWMGGHVERLHVIQGSGHPGTIAVAMSAVEIVAAQRLASSIAIDLIRTGISVVLVLVMPEMLGRYTAFVPAIRSHRSPGELERQQGKQDDREETTHTKESSSCGAWGRRAASSPCRICWFIDLTAKNLSGFW